MNSVDMMGYFKSESPTYMGRPRRTRAQYPYSYDPYVIYGFEDPEASAVYTDRLREWDGDKFAKCSKKHFGESYAFRPHDPAACQAFLADYMGKPLKLVCIMQHCNVSNGFPLWTLHYKLTEGN